MTRVAKRFTAGAGTCVATVTAIDDVTLRLGRGEVIAVVGPPSSGKTTLLRCAAGLIRPDEGNIRWMNLPTRRRPLRRPRYVDLRAGVLREEPPPFVPWLPLLMVDSCEYALASPRTTLALIESARRSGETIVLAARRLEACMEIVAPDAIAQVLCMDGGHIVSRG